MNSPVHAYLRSSTMIDFPGHLSAVFFVKGCNFRCAFCHNARFLGSREEGMPWDKLAGVCDGFAEQWVDAAVVTGGEPTLFDSLEELLRVLRKRGWALKLDTNGSNPERLARCLPLLDYVAMDIKAAPAQYPELTGWTDMAAISESVRLLREGVCDYEFRTTVLDGIHTEAQMTAIGEWIRGARRYVLQPFVPREDLPDAALSRQPRTAPDRLKLLRTRMQEYAGEVLIRGQ